MNLENFNYYFIKKSLVDLDYFILFKIYLPLLDFDSLNLYWILLLETQKANTETKENYSLNNLLLSANINLDKFIIAKEKLEKFNLLKTILDNENKLLYFELFKPELIDLKNSNSFVSMLFNNKFSKDKIEIISNEINSIDNKNYLNTKNDFSSQTKESIKNEFDFFELNQRIKSTTNINLDFSVETKKVINNYFLNDNLTINEIERSIYNSIVKENEEFVISPKLLDNNLSLLINSFNSINFVKQTSVNQNKNNFIEKLPINDLNIIFNKYKDMTSEQFVSLLLNREINWEEKNIIDKIRETYLLPDFLINIILDFSISKTFGNLNEKYLMKVSKSFTDHSISSIEEAYDYLYLVSSKKNKSKSSKEVKSFINDYFQNNKKSNFKNNNVLIEKNSQEINLEKESNSKDNFNENTLVDIKW